MGLPPHCGVQAFWAVPKTLMPGEFTSPEQMKENGVPARRPEPGGRHSPGHYAACHLLDE